MPEAPKPSPPFDRGVSRNLFVEADPDLDALIESPADDPVRAAGVRRRGRGLVVLAEQHRSTHAGRAHDVERFARPNGGVGRLRAVARHWLRQADAAAGRLLRGLADRPYRALVTIVAVALLLVGFSWLVLDVRDASTARAAAHERLARNATTLRHQHARIEALTTELRQLAQSLRQSQASKAPAGPTYVQPVARKPPPARRPYRRHR